MFVFDSLTSPTLASLTCLETEDILQFLFLLPPEGWDDKYVPSRLVCNVLGQTPGPQCARQVLNQLNYIPKYL